MARTYSRAFHDNLSTDFCGEAATTTRLSFPMNKHIADSIAETCDTYSQTADASVPFHLAGSRERGSLDSYGISENKLATARNILRYFATCLFLIGS